MGENCDNFITSAVGSGMGGGINSACSLVMNGSLAESTSSAHNTHSLSPIAHISSSPNSSSNQPQQFSADYLSQLLKDKKQLTAFPNIFMHMERLVDEEISKVRLTLFRLDTNKEALVLPDPDGNVVVVQEKVYVPVKEFPDYNFVGRILGPRGMTAKQLEQETGCKIMVRGKGSMRDKNKEEISRGKPNWEHLNDELHVLIQCEDTENRAKVKLQRAVEDIKRLLVPAAEGEDELKRKQLMELAIINGTYRPASQSKIALQTPRLLTPMTLTSPLRSPTLGAPIILSPTRLANITSSPSSLANSLAAVSPFLQGAGADFSAAAGLLYNYSLDSFAGLAAAYPFGNASFASPLMAAGDYQSLDPQAGAILTQRKLLGKATRDHPYQRASSIRTPTDL